MIVKHAFSKFYILKQEARKAGTLGIPMGIRLFLFLVVLMLTMLLGIVIILIVTGVFTAGLSESEKLIENELIHASQNITNQLGQISAHAVEFSMNLSQSIENRLDEQGKRISSLKEDPELLEKIISGEYERSLFSLQLAESSGVFIILDATVNPNLPNAKNSRAGLYIKNMEPNIISSFYPTVHILRGPPSISRKNSLSLHAQWTMEFDVSNARYYSKPIEAAINNSLPLSRLYYWTPSITLPNTSEEVMLCSVPLIDSNDNVFGVCGFEISAMLFKLSQMPNSRTYNRIFCVLSPLLGDTLDIGHAMFAGGYSVRRNSKDSNPLKIKRNRNSFFSYKQDNGESYLGFHTPIQLYPIDSAFSGEKWVAAVMVPEEDIVNSVVKLNLLLLSLLMFLMFFGVIISFILSRKYLKPISQGFNIIKSTDLSKAPKTKVPEIDDLIDFLSLHNEELHSKAAQEKLSLSVLDEFMKNTKTFSPAERSVFNLYVQGYTAKEIAEILCLSINTIKTHNRRIYMKLNVASREELLLYVTMLKEIGQEFK